MRSRLALFALVLLLPAGCRKKHYVYAPYPQPTYATSVGGTGQPPPTNPTAPPPVATGPVTDADRAAARDLFNEGITLQNGGKFAEALDRFQRSMSVFPAPTTALRMAQCKAALGRLVEAGEGYRGIMNTKIPPGSPPAFFDAQNTASQELAQLDPRIPRVKITVTGEGAYSGLVVTLDGQTVNLALLGVSRPVDPGRHTVSARARGLGADQTFEVKEKEQRDIQLVMKRM